MREASRCRTATDTDSYAFVFIINLLCRRGDDRGFNFLIMKSLKPNVCKFKVVIPGENWECEVIDLPAADLSANTAVKSEISKRYFGSGDEYYVDVDCRYDRIDVTVRDNNGNEVSDIEIYDVVEAD